MNLSDNPEYYLRRFDLGFVVFSNPIDIWYYHQTYFVWELMICLWSMFNLMTAIGQLNFFGTAVTANRPTGKYVFFWLTCVVYFYITEIPLALLPDITQGWHAQGVLSLFSSLPLATTLFYSVFVYASYVITEILNFSIYQHPIAVVLFHLCLNSTFDLTCFTYLWYVWHDTDPFAGVRVFGFPLVNVIFQAGSAYFLSLFFNIFWCENKSTLRKCIWIPFCGVFAFIATVVTHFGLFFHFFQDLNLNKFYGATLLMTIYLIGFTHYFFNSSRNKEKCTGGSPARYRRTKNSVLLYLVVILGIWVFNKPSDQISFGYHEEIGPCEPKTNVASIFGKIYERRNYLCLTDMRIDRMYDECEKFPLPKDAEMITVSWYAICGRDDNQHIISLVVYAMVCLISLLLLCSDKMKFKKA